MSGPPPISFDGTREAGNAGGIYFYAGVSPSARRSLGVPASQTHVFGCPLVALGWTHARRPPSIWRVALGIRKNSSVARVAGSEEPQVQAAGEGSFVSAYRTEDVIKILRKRAMPVIPSGSEVWLWGLGRHMGTQCAWSLRFSPSGAFREEIRSKHFTSRWGFSGEGGASCWEVDSSGVSKRLQLDDHENMLLVTWLRTGAWLLPAVADRLCFDEFCVSLPESLSGPWSTGLAGATWESSLDGDMLSEEGRRARLSGGQLGEGVGEESARDLIALKVRLASGRLWAYVMVSTTAWVPKGICLPYGDSEWWELLDWHQWAFERGAQGARVVGRVPGAKGEDEDDDSDTDVGGVSAERSSAPDVWRRVDDRGGKGRIGETTSPEGGPSVSGKGQGGGAVVPSPRMVEHVASAGGRNFFEILDVQLVPEAAADPHSGEPDGGSLRLSPPMVVRPADTTFVDLDPKRGHSFQGWVTPSGHVVVPVEVGGEPAGCFLVDTGASGLVIDPRLASRLRLPAFGEIFVTGMGGAIRSQFRRAPSLRVGAMVMSDPVLMELPVAPIVAATPETGEVMGILGYDFFRRTVLSVPCAKVPALRRRSRNGRPSSTPIALTMWDPETYVAPEHVERRWQPVTMISNLPHISIRFVGADNKEHTALFMVDSGGGSIDIMLHPRAVEEIGLGGAVQGAPTRVIKGVGKDVEVRWHTLPWAELSGRRYSNVDCLLAEHTGSGLDLSLYTAGIVCGDLLFRSEMVLDYARQRVAFLPRASPSEGLRRLPGTDSRIALSWGPFGVIGEALDSVWREKDQD